MNTPIPASQNDVDLSEFDEDFARAEPPRSEQQAALDDIPDGIYDALIEGVHLSRTASTGNPMIVWRLRIQGPQCKGRALTKVRVVTPKTLSFIKEDLDRLEIQLERLSELPGRTGEMLDRPVRVYKKTNAERRWADVHFLRMRKAPHREISAEEGWSTGTEDDLPF